MDNSDVPTVRPCRRRKYCDVDQDLDGGTVGGYGPQVIDAVYTLAKALDTLDKDDRQNPDLDLRGDQVRRVGWRFRELLGHRGPG